MSHRGRPAGRRTTVGQSAAGAAVSGERALAVAQSRGRRALAVDRLGRDTAPGELAKQPPRRRIAPALRTHRIRRLTAEDVVTVLRQPTLAVAPGVADAVEMRIASMVPQLVLIDEQRTRAELGCSDRRLKKWAVGLDASDGQRRMHRDVDNLGSMPGVGRMVTATMLTEAAVAVGRPRLWRRSAPTPAAAAHDQTQRQACLFRPRMRDACKWRLRLALYRLVAGQRSTRRGGPRLLRRTPGTRSRSRPGPSGSVAD